MSEYRLRPVRDARDRDERVKRLDLASVAAGARASAAVVEEAGKRVAAARAAVEAARAARDHLVGSGSDQAPIALADRFVTRRRAELETTLTDELRLRAAQAETDVQVGLARGRLAHAQAERKTIERHFANWRDQRRKLAERREE